MMGNVFFIDYQTFKTRLPFNLDLKNSLLEESDVKVEMGSPKVNVVLHVVLMLVQVELGMDGVFMYGQGVRYHIVGGHETV